MAAYAQVSDVQSRAGRLAPAWTATTNPALSDIEKMLDQTAGDIDAALGSMGIGLPLADDAPVRKALLSLNADMALALAIEGSWPGGAGNEETNAILEAVHARIDAAWGVDDEGRVVLSVTGLVSLLDTGEEGGANDFWSENPDYGLWGAEPVVVNPLLAPEVGRGMRF